jgi:hypothetical protein
MSRSYTSSPPSASMACSGTALPFFAKKKNNYVKYNLSEYYTQCKAENGMETVSGCCELVTALPFGEMKVNARESTYCSEVHFLP